MSLLVVGALHWDVVVRAPRLPRLDETLRGEAVDYRFGGKGGNQAVAAARAGAQVAFAGRIGSDDAGRAMAAELAAAGVDANRLQRGDGASGMSVAITQSDGTYGAVIVSGENLNFLARSIDIPIGCQIVLMQNEMAAGLIGEVSSKARAAGSEVWLNAAPATGIAAADLADVDMLVVNRVEGADLLGVAPNTREPTEILGELSNLAPRARIVLTLGGDGVAFREPGGPVVTAPAEQVKVRSTHGAGDVFVGTLAAAALSGSTFADAVQAAQQAAAAHISQRR